MNIKFTKIKGTNVLRISGLNKSKIETAFKYNKQFVAVDENDNDVFGIVESKTTRLGNYVLEINTKDIQNETLTITADTDVDTLLVNSMNDMVNLFNKIEEYADKVADTLAKIQEV